MHELSIMQALVDTIEDLVRRHRAQRVVRLVVEVGEMSNVIPMYLRNAFLAFREVKPFLAQAELEIRFVPLRLRCESCGFEFQPQGYRYRCVECGATRVRVIQGEELLLRDVELEVESENPGVRESGNSAVQEWGLTG
ncbi:Hydrogenase/urease nickel incorporation protein HypA [bacterium HR11]|nr:Hydrogenase/urease nickel incorporation protein HypA [bacterium HR11]